MTKFAEKVALITGGTSGIGRATAIAFGKVGAKVVISGRREAEGKETVKLIEQAGGKAKFVRSDLSEESDIKKLIDRDIAIAIYRSEGIFKQTLDVVKKAFVGEFVANG